MQCNNSITKDYKIQPCNNKIHVTSIILAFDFSITIKPHYYNLGKIQNEVLCVENLRMDENWEIEGCMVLVTTSWISIFLATMLIWPMEGLGWQREQMIRKGQMSIVAKK
jgi:hypothetical protein